MAFSCRVRVDEFSEFFAATDVRHRLKALWPSAPLAL